MKECTKNRCVNPVYAKDLCKQHYLQAWRAQQPKGRGKAWKKGLTKVDDPAIALHARKMKGAGNPAWKDGRVSVVRAAKNKRRKNVHRCERCGARPQPAAKAPNKRSLHVHHRNENTLDNRRRNLEVLCYRCHNKTHGPSRGKKGAAVRRQKASEVLK